MALPTIVRYAHEPWTVVKLTGDFDLSWAGHLRDEFTEATLSGTSPPRVAVDLSDVTFLDSSALSVIVGLYEVVTDHGGDLVVAGAQGSVGRVLHITQLDEVLHLADTLADVVDPAPGDRDYASN